MIRSTPQQGHNSGTPAGQQLRAFVERIERVEEEIKSLNGDKSEIYKELRGIGFDVKAVRQVVAARKLDTVEREEREALFDLYWCAINDSLVHVHVHEGNGSGGETNPAVRVGSALGR